MRGNDRHYQELEGFALELGHTAGGIARAYFRSSFSIENKDARGFDPVTSADHAIESVLRKTIRERYPEHGIVGEEEGNHQSDARFTWFIDPIDGTRAFMTGSPLWGTLIGLTEKRQPVCGVLSQPVLEEVFFGSPSGSWLVTASGRRRLQSRSIDNLSQAILTTTHPGMFSGESLPKFHALAGKVLFHRYGGDCYNYAMLAAGFVDLVVEGGLKPYDIVPLIPILEGAGCIVTDWNGKAPLDGGDVVAAATHDLHARALAVLKGAE